MFIHFQNLEFIYSPIYIHTLELKVFKFYTLLGFPELHKNYIGNNTTYHGNSPYPESLKSDAVAWFCTQAFSYLIVQMPCLVVSFSAALGKQGLVVDFDQLPLGAIAEVSEKPSSAQILKITVTTNTPKKQ